MKKRLFSLLSIVLIGSCIGLSGCGSSKSDSSNNDKATKSASTSTAPDANNSADTDNSSTTPTAPAKTYEPSAAAEKYATHPFLELWSAKEDVPYLAEYSSIPKH